MLENDCRAGGLPISLNTKLFFDNFVGSVPSLPEKPLIYCEPWDTRFLVFCAFDCSSALDNSN